MKKKRILSRRKKNETKLTVKTNKNGFFSLFSRAFSFIMTRITMRTYMNINSDVRIVDWHHFISPWKIIQSFITTRERFSFFQSRTFNQILTRWNIYQLIDENNSVLCTPLACLAIENELTELFPMSITFDSKHWSSCENFQMIVRDVMVDVFM